MIEAPPAGVQAVERGPRERGTGGVSAAAQIPPEWDRRHLSLATLFGLLTSHSTNDLSPYMTASLSPPLSKLHATASGQTGSGKEAAASCNDDDWSLPPGVEATGMPSPASSRGRLSLKASVLGEWVGRSTGYTVESTQGQGQSAGVRIGYRACRSKVSMQVTPIPPSGMNSPGRKEADHAPSACAGHRVGRYREGESAPLDLCELSLGIDIRFHAGEGWGMSLGAFHVPHHTSLLYQINYYCSYTCCTASCTHAPVFKTISCP